MKLSEMKQILADGSIQLTKSLGQNFLHDGNQLRRILGAAEIRSSDKILEIGPGLGPLTELLLIEASEVLAIEKDLRLVDFLRGKFSGNKKFRLIHDDALDLVRRGEVDWSEWKLVSNLPYSVASPILIELAESSSPPERMVVTLQMEVAQRITAGPDSAGYGLLTLLLQLRYQPSGLFKIPATCFFPAPDVESACIRLLRRPQPLLDAEETPVFKQIVKRAFSQRRKMMFKLLKEDWAEQKLDIAFQKLGISPQIRAEAVSLEQFSQITRELHHA